ncbi:MAG: sodium/proline symporter [Bacteroidota bacterium]
MEANRNLIIFICVIVYMLLCIGVGIWALRRTKSTHDFFMAGKSLGVWVSAFAVFSTTLSGFGFVGGPGLVYSMGMSSFWMVVVAIMGFNVSFSLLGKRLRLFAELGNYVSLPDVVYKRYGNNTTRLLMALAIVIGVVGYLATQVLAMAIVLRDILNAGDYFGQVSLVTAMIISCSILIFYSVTGGIIASVYTDMVQGAIMIVAAVLVFITVIFTFDNGLMEMNQIIYQDDRQAIGPWGTLGMIGSLSWLLLFGLGGAGQPHVITKLMMNKRISDAKKILPVSVMGYVFSALLWIGIGLCMRALVLSGMHEPLTSPDQAASQFLQYYAHPLLAGIVFAGLFAAIMSTAEAFLSIGTAAIMHDIPQGLGVKVSGELSIARITTVVLTILAALFAVNSGSLIAMIGAMSWGIFAAAVVPVVTLGFNWKRATPLAANVAIVVSLVIHLVIKAMSWNLPYRIDAGAFTLILSLTIFISMSLLSAPPRLDKEVEYVMDM